MTLNEIGFCFLLLLFSYDSPCHANADPCLTHTLISDAGYRGTNCLLWGKELVCDRFFSSGWYAAKVDGEYLQIPTTVPDLFTCGTDNPVWINGTHPEYENETVQSMGCVRGFRSGEECHDTIPLKIKKCTNFYVYYLQTVSYCNRGYCFGNKSCPVTTTKGTTTIHTTLKSTQATASHPTHSPPILPPSDPCHHAEVMPSMDRRGELCSASDYHSKLCDSSLKSAWYKAIYLNQFYDMPTSCVRAGACGTDQTIWLNGSLPKFEDGAVTRKACVRGVSECCSQSISIRIRNCLTYNVYFLTNTAMCDQAYCFGTGNCLKERQTSPVRNNIMVVVISSIFVIFSSICVCGMILYKCKRTRKGECKVYCDKEPPPPYQMQDVTNNEIPFKK